ncbi:MAG: hypothetical protein Q9195_007288 [Heterodermia aff. obscurata]
MVSSLRSSDGNPSKAANELPANEQTPLLVSDPQPVIPSDPEHGRNPRDPLRRELKTTDDEATDDPNNSINEPEAKPDSSIVGVISVLLLAAYKLLTLFGASSQILSYLLLVFRWRGDTSVWESLYIAPGGFGSGILNSTAFIALAAGVDETQMAIASTGFYLAGNIGALVGASVASKILVATLRLGLARALRGVDDRDMIIEKAVSNLGFVDSLEGSLREKVVWCYIQSFEYTHCEFYSVLTTCTRIHQLRKVAFDS